MLWNTAGLSGLGGVEQCTTGRVEIMRALSTQRRAGQPDRAGREESQPEIDQDLRQRRRQPKCCYTPPDIPQIASASNWQFSSSTSPHVSQSGHKTWNTLDVLCAKSFVKQIPCEKSGWSEVLDIFSLNLFKKAWVRIGAQIVTVFGFPATDAEFVFFATRLDQSELLYTFSVSPTPLVVENLFRPSHNSKLSKCESHNIFTPFFFYFSKYQNIFLCFSISPPASLSELWALVEDVIRQHKDVPVEKGGRRKNGER